MQLIIKRPFFFLFFWRGSLLRNTLSVLPPSFLFFQTSITDLIPSGSHCYILPHLTFGADYRYIINNAKVLAFSTEYITLPRYANISPSAVGKGLVMENEIDLAFLFF